MPIRLCHVLLLASCLVYASLAAGSGCVYLRFDADVSVELFGPAELVFIGTLERTEAPPRLDVRSHAQDQQPVHDDLEPLHIVGTRIRHTLGVFSVEKHFKAAGPNTVKVLMGLGGEIGQSYLVYANPDSERAGGYVVGLDECSTGVLPSSPRIQGMLAHLEHLPPAGSGGLIRLFAQIQPGSRPWAAATLRFAGPQGEFELRTDEYGGATAQGVAAGTYRLLTQAPQGLVLDCSARDNCANFVVYDRGQQYWRLMVQAPALLSVSLRDAAGKPTMVAPQFEFLNPDTGAVLESMVEEEWASNVELGRRFRLRTGRVVVALVLVDIMGKDPQFKVSRRRHVFSGGATSLKSAPQVDLVVGEQSFHFVLPAELQPVQTELQWIGERPGLSVSLSATTYSGAALGATAEQLRLHMDRNKMWSLPGQTLRIQLHNYRLIDTGAMTWNLSPNTTTTEVLHIRPL